MQSYLEVAVADQSYHGKELLTYATDRAVEVGAVVSIPIRDKSKLGIVMAIVRKPTFTVKNILDVETPSSLPIEQLRLLSWMQKYYASTIGAAAQLFVPSGFVPLSHPTKLDDLSVEGLPPLTGEQVQALSSISGPGMHLLHGDTGTGKTRIYIELTVRSLSQNKSAIILTPEIGLTSQLEQDFRKVFGNRVFIVHSQLKETVRRKIWSSILMSEKPIIVIGPRSALFTPVKHVGLIVVDEAHETAYKQDQAPYYHASRVAGKLGELHKAIIILGSATPLVADYYLAQKKQRPIIRMAKSAITSRTSVRNLEIIDLRDHRNQSRKPYISEALIKAIAE